MEGARNGILTGYRPLEDRESGSGGVRSAEIGLQRSWAQCVTMGRARMSTPLEGDCDRGRTIRTAFWGPCVPHHNIRGAPSLTVIKTTERAPIAYRDEAHVSRHHGPHLSVKSASPWLRAHWKGKPSPAASGSFTTTATSRFPRSSTCPARSTSAAATNGAIESEFESRRTSFSLVNRSSVSSRTR